MTPHKPIFFYFRRGYYSSRMRNAGNEGSVIPKLFVQIKTRCKKGPSLFA
jgi:hypothetical protein